jgi:hypothetical protein
MEIEFRGKAYIPTGKWVYGCFLIKSIRSIIFVYSKTNDGIHYEYEVYPKTIGQYTTKKDIEGTKLFVGDIIEYDGDTCEIVFQEEEARFIGINYPTMITASSFCKSKKIGTKYD